MLKFDMQTAEFAPHTCRSQNRFVRKLRWATRFAIAMATVWLAMSGLVAGHAFTLIGAILTVTPQAGPPTAPFTVRGVYATSCTGLGSFTFAFYWDTTIAQLTQKTVACNPASGFDTGQISGQVPPNGYNAVGNHTVILNVFNGSSLAPNGRT